MCKQEPEKVPGILSPEQIMNWRRVLSLQFGPIAYILPDAEIQEFRDKMQEETNKLAAELEKEELGCTTGIEPV